MNVGQNLGQWQHQALLCHFWSSPVTHWWYESRWKSSVLPSYKSKVLGSRSSSAPPGPRSSAGGGMWHLGIRKSCLLCVETVSTMSLHPAPMAGQHWSFPTQLLGLGGTWFLFLCHSTAQTDRVHRVFFTSAPMATPDATLGEGASPPRVPGGERRHPGLVPLLPPSPKLHYCKSEQVYQQKPFLITF